MIWGDGEDDEDEKEDKKSEENEEEKEKDKESEKDKKSQKEQANKSVREEDDESESDSRKIRTPKEKIIDLLKDKYHSIKTGIKNSSFKTVLENLDELVKNNDKINSIFKKEEIPSYYYECFALVEEVTNISKEEQKKLAKDNQENSNSLNSLKKFQVRILKKIGPALSEYKKNRKTEEELEKELTNIIDKQTKKGDESDDEDDIIQLMKRDEEEKKPPELRRLKWVKKIKVEEGKKPEKDGGKIKKLKKLKEINYMVWKMVLKKMKMKKLFLKPI